MGSLREHVPLHFKNDLNHLQSIKPGFRKLYFIMDSSVEDLSLSPGQGSSHVYPKWRWCLGSTAGILLNPNFSPLLDQLIL